MHDNGPSSRTAIASNKSEFATQRDESNDVQILGTLEKRRPTSEPLADEPAIGGPCRD